MNGTLLHFKGSKFYKVIKGEALYSGNITNNNITDSIYGEYFKDVKKKLRKSNYRGTGSLVTVESKKDLYNSKFYININENQINKNKAVFGNTIGGFNILKAIEFANPNEEIIIYDCGQL